MAGNANGSRGAVAPKSSVLNMANMAGAFVSLVLVIGVTIWGYRLVMRDVSGVPVIRAAEGPMRVQPVDPGGQSAKHQGLAINRLQADGGAEAPADQVMLAPDPVDLDDSDAAGLIEVSADAKDTITTPKPEVNRITSVPTEVDPDIAPQMASIQALADKLSRGAQPLSGIEPAETAPIKTSLQTVDETPVKPLNSLSKSLRPKARPGTIRVTQTPATEVASNATAEISADAVPAGTRLVQLGAFDSAEVAQAQWVKLTRKFEDYFGDKKRVIQKAQSGGRTFYRLRAIGFDDLADARRFCSALVAEKADCIPVVTR